MTTVDAAIEAGLAFLQSAQAGAGYWSDWSLPPGESRMWTTAYVAYRLSALDAARGTALDDSLQRAEQWLQAVEFPLGGWGYSDETGPDADSTSLALLFLVSRGSPVLNRSVCCLYAHQQHDGGVATYTHDASYGSWVQSHPEVTAVSALAMMCVDQPEAGGAARALRHLRNRERTDGLWDSFWWTTCMYATEASLSALVRGGAAFDRETIQQSLLATSTSCSFDSALRLMALLHVGCADAVGSARDLCAAQQPDGSWPGDARLRLTPRDCHEPWNAPEPPACFTDDRRVFTTATVVAALGALRLR